MEHPLKQPKTALSFTLVTS
ncbi:UNVERIFIED_CONTAM: hypothetical protein GTU68_017877 [Idotea baltica]|nr:hypothetical protein [Idotea baltica]